MTRFPTSGAAVALLLVGGVSALGQGLTVSSLSAPASQTDLSAAMQSMQAQIPQPASIVPPMETPVGAPGMAGTYRRGDAVQPRITRSKTVTLAGDGTATFDWTAQGALATPVQVATSAVYTGTGVPKCWATATSATAVSIKCVVENNTLISLAAVTAGLNLNGTSAAGLSVGVIVLPSS